MPKKMSLDCQRRRKLLAQWKSRTGNSYRNIVSKTNAVAGKEAVLYATVVSWGTRGHTPRPVALDSVKAAFPDFPL